MLITTQNIRWEAHTCIALHPDASFAPFDEYKACGVHYLSINIGMDMNPLSQILPVIASFRARLKAVPEKYVIPNTVEDIIQAANAGKIAVGFDLEGAIPLLEQPDMVALYRDLGVRQIHFAYNRNNSVAGGCHDVPQGLTALGRRMVDAVNAAGVLMDCSHTERRTTLDIMAHSAKPVIFSHANPLALAEHGRNITDEQIKACAATGGVICLSGVSRFLGSDKPNACDMARHAAYVANLVGTKHIGIGLDISFIEPELNDNPPGDFAPDYWWPLSAGYNRAISRMTYTPIITWQTLHDELQKVGMNAQDCAAILGGNMARVAQQVWHA